MPLTQGEIDFHAKLILQLKRIADAHDQSNRIAAHAQKKTETCEWTENASNSLFSTTCGESAADLQTSEHMPTNYCSSCGRPMEILEVFP